MKTLSTRSALVRFAMVAAASAAAASLWAQNRPEQGVLLDAQAWREEVATASPVPWPAAGWYRILATQEGIDVRNVRPSDRGAVPAQALFFRLPGTTLKTGLRTSYRPLEVLRSTRTGRDAGRDLGKRYTVRVEEVEAGVRYQIGYGAHQYTYVVGPKGSTTSVRGVADLDGDSRPDFVIDVDGLATYLLLSTKAQPGLNLPTAEMPASS